MAFDIFPQYGNVEECYEKLKNGQEGTAELMSEFDHISNSTPNLDSNATSNLDSNATSSDTNAQPSSRVFQPRKSSTPVWTPPYPPEDGVHSSLTFPKEDEVHPPLPYPNKDEVPSSLPYPHLDRMPASPKDSSYQAHPPDFTKVQTSPKANSYLSHPNSGKAIYHMYKFVL